LLNKLVSFLKNCQRLVIIGMGNELRADDAVGLEVVRRLKPFENSQLFVFEGHMTPEVFIQPACIKHPTHLLIIDAAELHKKPGEWDLLPESAIDEGMFTTHSIPATEVTTEIRRRCHTKVAFLGIQPKSREISLNRSAECQKTVQQITDLIQQILKETV
jgi:hydrogenase 3 maturation protease